MLAADGLLHAGDLSALGVQVSHDVAGEGVGNDDLQVHDGFEKDDADRRGGVLQCLRCGHLERDVGGVDGVELPVVERHLHVHHRVAGQGPLRHRLDEALLNGADELPGDRAADDLVHELEPAAPGERLDLEVADRVLTVTSRLLDVASLGLRRRPDRLPVGDLGGVVHDLDAELALHALHRHVEVGLAHPVHHGLVGLVGSLHAERRVLLPEPRQGRGELVLVPLRLRLDRVGKERLRHLDRGDRDGVVFRGERVAGRRVRELRDRADVARRHLGDGIVLLAAEREELADALLRRLRGVEDRGVRLHASGEDAEHRDVTDVGVGHRLEHERGEGSVRIVRPLLLLSGCRASLGEDRDRRPLGRRRELVGDELQQPVDADGPRRRAEQDRRDPRLREPRLHAVHDLVLGELSILEVLLDQRVVGLRDGLHELLPERIRLGVDVVRPLAFLRSRPRPVAVGLHRQEIRDALERVLLPERELQRRDLRSERGDERLERALERGPLAVELVDQDRAGESCLHRELPRGFGLDLHAFDGGDDDQDGVDSADRTAEIADEISIAGRVEHVDLDVSPLHRREREGDADALADLLLVVVRDGVAVLDPSHTRERAGGEQHRFDQRGLAGASVADEEDVADVGRVVGVHRSPNRWRSEARF